MDSTTLDDEQAYLERLGYKQALYRGLGVIQAFTIGSASVSVLVSLVSTFTYGLTTGGPVAMVWGWILASILTIIIAYSLAEICSAFPAAGSVYYYSAQLVPREYAPIVSYWTGLFNYLGNSTGDAAFAYTFAVLLSAALEVSGYDSLSTNWKVGVALIVLTVWSVLNFFRVDEVGWMNNIGLVLQLVTTILIVVVVLSMAPTLNSWDFVFTDYYNDTGFSSTVYVCCISVLIGIYGLTGYDGSSHMAEETQNTAINAPLSIIYTVVAAVVVGFATILALLFGVQSISDAIDGDTDNAAIEIIVQATSTSWAIALTWLLTINLLYTGIGSVTVTARITYALMRDKAIPHHEYWTELDPTFQSPIKVVIFLFVFDAIILLLPLVSETAFLDIVGVCSVALQVSYGIPIASKFLAAPRRVLERSFTEKNCMYLGGYSVPFGVLSTVWIFGTAVLCLLPTSSPITASTFNWTSVIVGGFAIVMLVNWYTFSGYTFTGPKIFDDNNVGQDSVSENRRETDPLLGKKQ